MFNNDTKHSLAVIIRTKQGLRVCEGYIAIDTSFHLYPEFSLTQSTYSTYTPLH
jgi:hypothetical protein